MGATRNHLGKSIFFSATLPATNDADGFEALTWTELEYGQSYPQFGITHANIDVEDLKSGFTKGIKGAGTGTDSQGSCRIEDSALTANQTAFKAICDDENGLVALKIGTGTGTNNALQTGDTVTYAAGYAHSFQPMQANASGHEGFTYNFRQNDPDIVATEPTP